MTPLCAMFWSQTEPIFRFALKKKKLLQELSLKMEIEPGSFLDFGGVQA